MYWCATTGGHVVYESRLELARLLLADFDPDVDRIWAQPCLLEAPVGGRVRRHVPDFLLVSPAGAVTVVNVKPASRLTDPKVAAALAWPGTLVTRRGWGYQVWSGGDPVMVENVRFLAAYRRPGLVDDTAIAAALEHVEDGEPLGLAETRLAAGAPGWTVRPLLLTLLWRHRLVTDLSRPLSTDSPLHHAAQDGAACAATVPGGGAGAWCR